MTTARRIMVRGRVQGVWFRASTRAEAARLGVAGWVRNRPDGAVEAHLEGDREAVSALAAWCAIGPPGASVASVESTDVEVLGLSGFEIRP